MERSIQPRWQDLGFSQDDSLILWDAETHQIIGEPLRKHIAAILSVAFSPDGKTLASGGTELASNNWGLTVWDLETREPTAQISDFPAASIAFSPDGRYLAAGGGGSAEVIMVWNAETLERIDGYAFIHSKHATSLAFSSDGEYLASGGYDSSIILWDAQTQQPLGDPLKVQSDFVDSVTFSPYGMLDMAGNAWEWVSSLYLPYPYDAADGREDQNSSDLRVLRGGSWNSGEDGILAAYRFYNDPTDSYINMGIRCARDVAP